MAEVKRRMMKIKKDIVQLVLVEDAFGLDPRTPTPLVNPEEPTVNARFSFLTSDQKSRKFADWLRTQVDTSMFPSENEWYGVYSERSMRQGMGSVFDDLRRMEMMDDAKIFAGSRREFLTQAFSRPVSTERLQALTGRVFTELKGVTAAMETRITRTLADGIAQGQSPRTVARTMASQVDGITKQRALTIARTETIRAHAEGQLTSFELMGVERVGVAVEWSTAGDDRVCPLCQPLEGVVLEIKEARNMLPRHPNCRCAFIPANVGEDEDDQKRTARMKKSALDKSVKAETQDPDQSRWKGADLKPKKIKDQI